MITYAAITWAVLTTALGLSACAICEGQRRWKKYWANEAKESLELADRSITQRDTWRNIATDLEDRLRRIERQRHESAKKARAAQIAKITAKRAETTAKLKAEVGL